MTKILIIEARYYEDISDALLEGAMSKLNIDGLELMKITVPGALEIPHVISYAEAAGAGYDLSLIHISEPTRPY